ncbi:MAG: hypothetical protein K2N51_08805 [Lachnospiraceae bacterium]|nr:hypothetical protein [Lachnospiraceae bacterium]
MVTMLFDFNKEKAEQYGYNLNEVISEIRSYFKENGACETKYLFFELEGEDAMCIALSYIVKKTEKDPDFIQIMNKCIADIDGEKEDCIKELFEWNQDKGIA